MTRSSGPKSLTGKVAGHETVGSVLGSTLQQNEMWQERSSWRSYKLGAARDSGCVFRSKYRTTSPFFLNSICLPYRRPKNAAQDDNVNLSTCNFNLYISHSRYQEFTYNCNRCLMTDKRDKHVRSIKS